MPHPFYNKKIKKFKPFLFKSGSNDSKVNAEYEKFSRSPSREHNKKFSLSSTHSLVDKRDKSTSKPVEVTKPVEVAVNTEFDPFEETEYVKELKMQLKELRNEINKLQTAQITLAQTIKDKEQAYTIDTNLQMSKQFDSIKGNYEELIQTQENSVVT